MKADKDHIKDIFSSKLEGFEADLPPSLWNKIEADLPVQSPIKPPLKKPIYRILGWTAAAAVIFAVLYFMPQNSDNIHIAKVIEDKTIARGRSLVQFKVDNRKDNSDNMIIKEAKTQPTLSLLATASGQFVAKTKTLLMDEAVSGSISSEGVTPGVNTKTENKVQDVQDVYVADAANQENFQPKDPDFERELKSKIAAFAAVGDESKNILADNNDLVKSEKKGGAAKGIAIGIGGGGGFSKSNDVANTFRYANTALAADGIYTLRSQQFRLEHNQPVSFGIAVNKKLTNRISLESGIVYTYVSARIRMDGQSEYNQNDQQYFHYFGVPLSVNYKLAEWKKFQFYTSLGGMVQKDFYGRIESKSSIDDLLNSERSSKRNISQSRPQFSATALMGISYPLYNKLSVYTTFGGAYYFQANNEYETIFSDRKWLFNFNLGLKFGF